MGKRYGRNQKRRHREELAQAQAEAAGDRRQANVALWEAEMLRRQLNDAAKVLGTDFAGFEPKLVNVAADTGLRDPWRLPVRNGSVLMRSLMVDIDMTHAKDHTDMVHVVQVTLAGERVAYSISEPALRNMPPEILVQRIATEIARLLVPQVRALFPPTPGFSPGAAQRRVDSRPSPGRGMGSTHGA